MVYPIGYEGQTRRWYAESVDGATVVVGDIPPMPGDTDLAYSLASTILGGCEYVKHVKPEAELVG